MLSHSSDTIIIGAGIIGASIAWRLAQAGMRVTLVDAGVMGGEASWAGAGMLAPGGEVQTRDVWTDLALESMSLYPDFVRELEAASGTPIDYRRCGAVELAYEDAEWQSLLQRAETQREMGIQSYTLDDAELRRRSPLLAREVAGALFYPGDSMVDPRDIMRALRVTCCKLGVEIRERWRVRSMRVSGNGVEIQGDDQKLRTGAAVLAAGAWASDIAVSGLVDPLPAAYPIRGHLVGFLLASGSLDPMLRRGHTYLLQRSSGFTVAGTSSERVGFDRRVDSEIVADIVKRTRELVPALRALEPETSWIGFRPASDSPGPEIRRVPGTNLWLAYGHYRNGILLAPLTARQISAEMTSTTGATLGIR